MPISTAGSGERIRTARESVGLSQGELATRLEGMNSSWVDDLESDDDELATTLSLQEVCDLAAILSMSPRELVCGGEAVIPPVTTTAHQVSEAIRARISTSGMDIDAYGDMVGWDVAAVIDNPHDMWASWCVEGLADVCDDLEIDWRTVLPSEVTTA